MKNYDSLIVFTILVICLSGCTIVQLSGRRTHSLNEFKGLNKTDRIKVQIMKKNDEGVWIESLTKTIDTSEEIDLITKSFQKYSDGWQSGYFPYLPGRLMVEFYEGEELIVPIIVVSYSNSSGEGLSYFLSRPAGPARPIKEDEFREIMKLLEINEDLAYYEDMVISQDTP